MGPSSGTRRQNPVLNFGVGRAEDGDLLAGRVGVAVGPGTSSHQGAPVSALMTRIPSSGPMPMSRSPSLVIVFATAQPIHPTRQARPGTLGHMGASELIHGVLAGDRRSVARAISMVEDGGDELPALSAGIFAQTGRAYTVGLTGCRASGSRAWPARWSVPPASATRRRPSWR